MNAHLMNSTDKISYKVDEFVPFRAPEVNFVENPSDWDLNPVTSACDIAANAEVLGLNGFVGRLTAAQQKKIFGANIFGKKRIYISTEGRGFVLSMVSGSGFGGSKSVEARTFDRIAAIARNDEIVPVSTEVEW